MNIYIYLYPDDMSKAMSGYGVRAGIIRRKYLPLSTDTVYIIKNFEIGTFTPQIYSFKNLKRLENKKDKRRKKTRTNYVLLCFFDIPNGVNKTQIRQNQVVEHFCATFSIQESLPKYGGPKFCVFHLILQALGHPYFEASPNTPAHVWVCNCEKPQPTWFGKMDINHAKLQTQRHFSVQTYISRAICIFSLDVVVLHVNQKISQTNFACMYVCMYVRMFACLLVCLFACLFVGMFIGLFVGLFVCVLVCRHACKYVCLAHRQMDGQIKHGIEQSMLEYNTYTWLDQLDLGQQMMSG